MKKADEKFRDLQYSDPSYENNGVFIFPHYKIKDYQIRCIISEGEGWEHASVTIAKKRKFPSRCPTWEEMCWGCDLLSFLVLAIFDINRNPGGNMGVGATIRRAGKELFVHSKFIPAKRPNSNNVAEYMAFESILDELLTGKFKDQRVHVCGDSKLVIEQMRGIWQIKFGRYVTYAKRCVEKVQQIRTEQNIRLSFQWIPRGQNGYADELSKRELINNGIEFKIQPLSQDHLK